MAGKRTNPGFVLPAITQFRENLSEMTIDDWETVLEEKLYNLVASIRNLSNLQFLVVGTKFDGLHGLSVRGARNVISGATAGFAKAIAREQDNILVKVVDFEENEKSANVASRLVEETLFDPSVHEVAWEGNQRFTIVCQTQELDATITQPLPSNAVFLVSGGTGGITSPILVDLAKATKGHFYLLARSVLPERSNPLLQQLVDDPEQLKVQSVANAFQRRQKSDASHY